MTIKESQPPKILYKYRTFDLDGYTQAMLEKGEIYFPTTLELNDPCEHYFTFENEVTRTLSHLERDRLKAHIIRITSENQHGGCVAVITPEANARYLMAAYSHHGIFSLSATPLSLFMWSFYGAALHGICIGFDWSAMGYEIPPHKVTYQEHPVIISEQMISSPNNKRIVTTKSKYFEWEEEYRIFDTAGKKVSGEIRNSIKKIIFGEHVSEKKIREVIIQTRGIPNVQYYIAKRIIGKFKIKIVQLNVEDFAEQLVSITDAHEY